MTFQRVYFLHKTLHSVTNRKFLCNFPSKLLFVSDKLCTFATEKIEITNKHIEI